MLFEGSKAGSGAKSRPAPAGLMRIAVEKCVRRQESRWRRRQVSCLLLTVIRSNALGWARQAANSVGKMICPLNFALFAAASNIVTPQAVSVAVLPACLFLAFRMLPLGPLGTSLCAERRLGRTGRLAADADAAGILGPVEERSLAARGPLA